MKRPICCILAVDGLYRRTNGQATVGVPYRNAATEVRINRWRYESRCQYATWYPDGCGWPDRVPSSRTTSGTVRPVYINTQTVTTSPVSSTPGSRTRGIAVGRGATTTDTVGGSISQVSFFESASIQRISRRAAIQRLRTPVRQYEKRAPANSVSSTRLPGVDRDGRYLGPRFEVPLPVVLPTATALLEPAEGQLVLPDVVGTVDDHPIPTGVRPRPGEQAGSTP